jgi:hypothetical protein
MGIMGWAEHVEITGESRGVYRDLVGKFREEGPLEDLGLDGWIILKWIFRT